MRPIRLVRGQVELRRSGRVCQSWIDAALAFPVLNPRRHSRVRERRTDGRRAFARPVTCWQDSESRMEVRRPTGTPDDTYSRDGRRLHRKHRSLGFITPLSLRLQPFHDLFSGNRMFPDPDPACVVDGIRDSGNHGSERTLAGFFGAEWAFRIDALNDDSFDLRRLCRRGRAVFQKSGIDEQAIFAAIQQMRHVAEQAASKTKVARRANARRAHLESAPPPAITLPAVEGEEPSASLPVQPFAEIEEW